MICKWDIEDIVLLLVLWLDSMIYVYFFISESYWCDSVVVVWDVYFFVVSIWVWEQDGELKGFVSVLDFCFVGVLFVVLGVICQGIGWVLLDEIKQYYVWLSFEVYQKNELVVSFYYVQGFWIEDCVWQDDIQYLMWIMCWLVD